MKQIANQINSTKSVFEPYSLPVTILVDLTFVNISLNNEINDQVRKCMVVESSQTIGY